MKIGVCIEGQNDLEAVQSLLSKINSTFSYPHAEFVIRPLRGYANLINNVHQILFEFNCLGMDLIVVLADNDREEGQKRFRQLTQKCKDAVSTYDLTVPCIAIQALEAWLLADEGALSRVTQRTIPCQPNPEEIPFPKESLQEITQYHSMGMLYPEVLEAIVNELNLDLVLNRCKSFSKFYSSYCQKFRNILGS